ncbi:MAG: AAA family ATPase [Reyranellaceae bacterium]
MGYTIRPATRADSKVLIGLYGQSGCGKTLSALLLARGLVGEAGKVVLIDTESGRGSLYADVVPGGYGVIQLEAPFSPTAYMEAMAAAEQAGAECIIVDSMSHEWEGLGGVADMAAQIEARTGKPGLHCWKEPKTAHQRMLLKLLQAKSHVICCLRAKRKSRQVKDERTGKTAIVKDDFYTPKQDQDFIFELTAHAEILPDHALRVTKVSHPALAEIFRNGVVISTETGRAIAAWSKGGADSTPIDKTAAVVDELLAEVNACTDGEAVDAIMAREKVQAAVAWMLDRRKDQHTRLFDGVNAKRRELLAKAAA